VQLNPGRVSFTPLIPEPPPELPSPR
jgi:hypothetical protein